MGKLARAFFRRPDVLTIARELLGTMLYTRLDGVLSGGQIVETEAYAGPEDRASHAYGDRRTARTETMYQAGGVAYVYLCYGMHAMLNVVTNADGVPHAILVRAIEPRVGVAAMLARRGMTRLETRLGAGPGALTKALGVTTALDGADLRGGTLWIEGPAGSVPSCQVTASPRVGVAYAGPHARWPWRLRVRDCRWTSPAK